MNKRKISPGNNDQPRSNECLFKPISGQINIKIEPTEEDNQRQALQQKLQNHQLRIATIQNWITAISAVLSLVALWFLYQSTSAATNQAKTAHLEFVSSQRAWIALDVKSIRQLPSRAAPAGTQQVHFYIISFSLRNVGHSVARTVGFSPVLVQSGKETGHECDRSKAAQEEFIKGEAGFVIFPGDGAASEIPWAPGAAYTPDKDKVIGCVSYRTTVDETFHYTKMPYFLGETTPNQEINLRPDINGAHAD